LYSVEEAESKRTSKLLIVDRTKRTHLGGSKLSEIIVDKGGGEGDVMGRFRWKSIRRERIMRCESVSVICKSDARSGVWQRDVAPDGSI
jgi:hypothetical protein